MKLSHSQYAIVLHDISRLRGRPSSPDAHVPVAHEPEYLLSVHSHFHNAGSDRLTFNALAARHNWPYWAEIVPPCSEVPDKEWPLTMSDVVQLSTEHQKKLMRGKIKADRDSLHKVTLYPAPIRDRILDLAGAWTSLAKAIESHEAAKAAAVPVAAATDW